MIDRHHGMAWIAGLVAAVLLGGCQAAENPPVSQSAEPTSRFETLTIAAPSLLDNKIGEKSERSISVYLPPSYFTSETRYPVIYYLPGFTDTRMLGFELPGGADKLMGDGTIHEMIIVVADGANVLGGSFYVNSPVTGRWEDFIVKDVVGYVDTHYRSVSQAGARAISGHSMGGFGALHIAMRQPDVFSAVYGLSPGLFDSNGLAETEMFASESSATSFMDYLERTASLPVQQAQRDMLNAPDSFTLAYGLAFASNPQKRPPYLDYPYTTVDGKRVRDDAIWQRWESGFGGIPEKVQQYKDNLLRLNGLVVDYGRQDGLAWIPKGCEYFAAQLTAADVPHELRSYDGGHGDKVGERIGSFMLPFLSERLSAN